MDFQDAMVGNVLPIYKELTHTELIIDSRVRRMQGHINFKTEHPVSDQEAEKLMEKVLLEQAGVVITRLDNSRVSVTYNDALPLLPTQKPKER